MQVIIRDKKIEAFEDNKADGLKIEELVNIEAIYASHNLLKDLYGIGKTFLPLNYLGVLPKYLYDYNSNKKFEHNWKVNIMKQ